MEDSKTPEHQPSAQNDIVRARRRAGPKGVNLGKGADLAIAPVPDEPVDTAADPVLSRRELIVRLKARADTDGVNGKDLRRTLDAVLDELGAALLAGETLNLPPLGSMRVTRKKDTGGADVMICRLRRKKPGAPAIDPLAVPAE